MPLYEYECQQCHKRTEKRQKFSDPEITECPFCGGLLQRVLSAPAFSFAGGGWYKDLYSSQKPAAKGSGEAGGESKGETKPAAGDSSSAPASPAPATAAAPPSAASAPPPAASSEKK